jgi:hypothetical protein
LIWLGLAPFGLQIEYLRHPIPGEYTVTASGSFLEAEPDQKLTED